MKPEDRVVLPARLGAWMLLACALGLGFLPFLLPSPQPVDAPASGFSALRARARLELIAAAPRPVGSARHDEVRDGLVSALRALGLEVQVQTAQVFVPERGHPFTAATVHNVVARLPGRSGAHAVLLVGHYDSVPSGPGASDDGAAVASLLETARALRQGAPPANDILLLFSDAEEQRLLGATAFQRSHPWAQRVAAVLNFDARGTGGPILMFESGPGNGWLVRQLAATAHPVANSLSTEVYKRMPNGTDLTVFLEAGGTGLNFANMQEGLHYHSRLEDLEHLDLGTLQHQGELMLSLARQLGDADLTRVRDEDALFFNVGTVLVHYPARWAWPMLGLVLALGAGAWRRALRRGGVRARGIAWSAVGLLLATAVSAAAVWLAWSGARSLRPDLLSLPEGQTYQDAPFMLGFTLLALGCHTGALALLRPRTTLTEVAAAATLLWLVPCVLTTAWMPGASYLCLWPLLGAVLALAVGPPEDGPLSPGGVLALGLSAAPGLVLVAPVIFSVLVALTLSLACVATVLTALLLISLAPVLRVLLGRALPLTAGAALGLGASLVLAGTALGARFDARHPRPDSAIYLLDADSHTARWVSSDPLRDDWLARFLGPRPESRLLEGPYPGWPRPVWTAPAPSLALPPPTVEVVKDETREGLRDVTLRVSSHRQAPLVELQVDARTRLRELKVAGTGLDERQLQKAWAARGGPRLQYWAAPPEGFEVSLQVEAGPPLRLRVSDHTFLLPDLQGLEEARTEGSMPVPFGDGLLEGTRVTRTLEL